MDCVTAKNFVSPSQANARGTDHDVAILTIAPDGILLNIADMISDSDDVHSFALVNRRFLILLLPYFFGRSGLTSNNPFCDGIAINSATSPRCIAAVCQAFWDPGIGMFSTSLRDNKVQPIQDLAHVVSRPRQIDRIFIDHEPMSVPRRPRGKSYQAIEAISEALDLVDKSGCEAFYVDSNYGMLSRPLVRHPPNLMASTLVSEKFSALKSVRIRSNLLFSTFILGKTLEMLNAPSLSTLILKVGMTSEMWELMFRLICTPKLQLLQIDSFGQLKCCDLAHFVQRHPSIDHLVIGDPLCRTHSHLGGWTLFVKYLTLSPQALTLLCANGLELPQLTELRLEGTWSESLPHRIQRTNSTINQGLRAISNLESPNLTRLTFSVYDIPFRSALYRWLKSATTFEHRFPGKARPERAATSIRRIVILNDIDYKPKETVRLLGAWFALFPALETVSLWLDGTSVKEWPNGPESAKQFVVDLLQNCLPHLTRIHVNII